MFSVTSERKVFKCVCQEKLIYSSELREHLLKPLHHIITVIKPKKTLNEITEHQIKQRINFIKSSITKLDQYSQNLNKNIQNNSLIHFIKLYKIYLNSDLNPLFDCTKHSQLTKIIKIIYNSHTILEVTNFKYLKNIIHKNFNLFLKSHISQIMSISIEENLKMLIVGEFDGSVRIFSLESLNQIACLHYHESVVNVIHSKSVLCLSGSYDSKICLFNLKSKKLKTCFKTCNGKIISLMISADSKFFLSGSEKGYIEIWSIISNCLAFKINAKFGVMFARFIQNDCFIICCTIEGSIQKFNLEQKYHPMIKKQYKDDLYCSSLIEGNDILLTGHKDGFIQVLKQFQLFKTFKAHSQKINTIDYCSKTGKFVSGSDDETAKVWSLSSFSLLAVLDHFKQIILCVKLLNNTIIASGRRKDIEYFDLSSQEVIKTTNQRKFDSFVLSISIKLKLIVYGFESIYLHSLSSNSDICCRSFESNVCYLVFSSSFITCGTAKGFIYCVDTVCLEIKKKYFFGVSPVRFVRTTKNWEVMGYSSNNKSIVRDLRNLEILLTHNRRIEVGKFRRNRFVFEDEFGDLYISIEFKNMRKISNLRSFQLFWCRSIDYVILKDTDSGFSIFNMRILENEIKLERLKGIKFMNKKREFSLTKRDLILSSLKFRTGRLN